MQRLYDGYKINVAWCDKTLGFQYAIYNKDGKKVSGSLTPYCFEEYALTRAMQVVDALNESGGDIFE